jgi:hypothetical protein
MGLTLNWRWVDLSKADGYALFAQETMAWAAPNSVVMAPWSSAVVLEYYQVVEGLRPDLLIINRSRNSVAMYYDLWRKGYSHEEIITRIESEEKKMIEHYMHHKTIYAVDYDPVLAESFEYLPDGVVFRLAKP